MTSGGSSGRYYTITPARSASARLSRQKALKKQLKKHKISFKKVLTTHALFRIIIEHCDAELCNGSTCDSDSHCEGSNPSSATKRQRMLPFFRGIAQMVARCVRDAEALSSNLNTPTTQDPIRSGESRSVLVFMDHCGGGQKGGPVYPQEKEGFSPDPLCK